MIEETYSIFVNAKNIDPASLKSYTEEDVISRLLAWFRMREDFPHALDEELFGSVGLLLGEAGFKNLDALVWQWFKETFSAERHEIVVDFLCGYWRTSFNYDRTTVFENMKLLDKTAMESWRFAAGCFSLYKLLVSKENTMPADDQSIIRSTLLSKLEQMNGANLHPGIASFLERLRNQ